MPLDTPVRYSVQLAPDLAKQLQELAASTGTTLTDIMGQAIALMFAAHDAKEQGRHVGIASDPERLDTEFVGLI